MAVILFVVVLLVSDGAQCDNDDVVEGNEAEQASDRRIAVKLYRIFAAEHGVVNLRASSPQTSCDGSPVESPCYTAPEPVLGRSSPRGQANQKRWYVDAISGQREFRVSFREIV